MRNDLIVSKSIIINTTPDKIWNVLTNPERIKEYLYGTETLTTWEPGKKVTFSGNYNGHKYQDHGTVLENIKNKKLSYSYWSIFSGLEDKPENYSIVTYELKEVADNQTEFTWTQKGYSTEENYKHSLDGMDDFLMLIKKIAE
ncbi:MAG: SRPBCC domain-containing protein [Bacteroidales bacterium]|jgi:uncharacterized protein YndB with AHSA1/START domain|nr:SRPBCC domain-containing protein [Bacteroidales bacterium]